MRSTRLFEIQQRLNQRLSWVDLVVLVGIATFVYTGVRLALAAPEVIERPAISLDPAQLPLYAALSVSRMAGAYVLALLFALTYGYVTAYHQRVRRILMPLLDVLQSVPILSFLPVVVLSLAAILPEGVAVELGSIILIFTSQ